MNHKILNDTMEKSTVIIAFLCQFQEIITVDGSIVIQANNNVSKHCLNLYFHLSILVFADKITQNQIKILDS